MKRGNFHIALFSATGMLVLILDGKTALHGAITGMDLCIRTLIPSLFPFFVLSILLTGALSGQPLKWLQPIGTITGIPKGAESLLAVSILGGYPVGAQSISLLHQQGQIDSSQAMRLLAFCNNAGPAFIFGVLGTMFTDRKNVWLLWFIHIFSAFFVGAVLPKNQTTEIVQPIIRQIRITDALAQALKTMALVCGWVICIKIILVFTESWFLRFLPASMQIVISGITELSNGCLRLPELECEGLRFLIASFFLSFGGLCVTLQTASVADGISMKFYFPGKMLQCCISILLSCVFQFSFPPASRCNCPGVVLLSASAAIFLISFFRYSKKVVEFRRPLMYN